ncbi:MAG: urease accessory protein UreJ [Roseateles depolymerans]|uniref:Urease accessory protein UreJ n=1 Tax=Roseateles depolymerans TaxID=76731 RepID=A0A2W5DRI3_9BURK|nr:MAG: urease accessory protein UreJ [Roseateles depolymerans]
MKPKQLALPALLALAAPLAQAHPGHEGLHSLADGLAHPLAADHLLAMLAVGLWAARQSGVRRGLLWAAPALFLTALLAGAGLGAALGAGPWVELGVALSVAVFGALLLARELPAAAGLACIGVGGLLHGLAHGAEMPVAGLAGAYAGGFLLSTALLHGLGLVAGLQLQRLSARARQLAWASAGALLGGSGLWLLARV